MSDQIEIVSVKNLIPVEINFKENNKFKKIQVYVDYSSQEVIVSDDTLSVETIDKLKEQFFKFIYSNEDLPFDLFAENSPTVPKTPKEEDITW